MTPAENRDTAIADAAQAFAELCRAQRDLIEAEAELVRARAARVRAEPPPPTREQIVGSAPADVGRRSVYPPGPALSVDRASVRWGHDPAKWPGWTCGGCEQANSGWAMECGRCQAARPA